MTSSTFSWLHLSDLHVGMTSQGWLWPNVKAAFFDDLQRLHSKSGPWDLVIFSGDLTRAGTVEEFSKFDELLEDLWAHFSFLGSTPLLFTVPGNHDLSRPDNKDPAVRVLKNWLNDTEIHNEFWDGSSPYSECVRNAFSNYANWVDKRSVDSPWNLIKGTIVGDTSLELNINGVSLGLVGLNSTWLQLQAGDFSGKLHVDVRQLLSVTGDDPDGWCRRHDINFLVTHHPSNWLSNKEHWRGEIEVPGRFDAHLFGHMHTPDALTVIHGGSGQRTSIQAASLFGLEMIDDNLERIHGYSAGRLVIEGSHRTCTVWPRILTEHVSGKRRLIPDHRFELNEDNAFEHEYENSSVGLRTAAKRAQVPAKVDLDLSPSAQETGLLAQIRHNPSSIGAHSQIRIIEQRAAADALGSRRAFWLFAEWGMGSEGFISSVQKISSGEPHPSYRIDFSGYSDRESFLNFVKTSLGFSFEQLCELLSRETSPLIVFDDVSISPANDAGRIQSEIENIVSAVLEYCPSASLIVKSRSALPKLKYPSFTLRPLDEPDTATYIRYSELGGAKLSKPEAVAKIHRHTDGAPERIDTALKELKVVRLSDLLATNPDFGPAGLVIETAPPALVRAIDELRDSEDPVLKRCYNLLKTLSAFPQGEQLERIKRFNNAAPYFPAHAAQLMDRGLISAASVLELGPSEAEDNIRILTVSKSTRDFLRSRLKSSELDALDRRAMELYFGPDWRFGTITIPVGHRFDDPLQIGFKLANANALLVRFSHAAQSSGSADRVVALRILASYIASLLSGDHYRSVVALCGDVLPLFSEDEFPSETLVVKSQFARALRMLGETEKARDILETADIARLPKILQRSALINLALCYQTLDETALATNAANRVIALGKNEGPALQARAIILEMDVTNPRRYEDLFDLRQIAARKKLPVLANSIALALTVIDETRSEIMLNEILAGAHREKDFYNQVRAIVKVSKQKRSNSISLTEIEKSRLIDAYHFLFNERLPRMFDDCHDALWSEFEDRGDAENLLRLFRHSSLIWRLRGLEGNERKFIKRLAKRMSRVSVKQLTGLDRERSYYQARMSAAVIQD